MNRTTNYEMLHNVAFFLNLHFVNYDDKSMLKLDVSTDLHTYAKHALFDLRINACPICFGIKTLCLSRALHLHNNAILTKFQRLCVLSRLRNYRAHGCLLHTFIHIHIFIKQHSLIIVGLSTVSSLRPTST